MAHIKASPLRHTVIYFALLIVLLKAILYLFALPGSTLDKYGGFYSPYSPKHQGALIADIVAEPLRTRSTSWPPASLEGQILTYVPGDRPIFGGRVSHWQKANLVIGILREDSEFYGIPYTHFSALRPL